MENLPFIHTITDEHRTIDRTIFQTVVRRFLNRGVCYAVRGPKYFYGIFADFANFSNLLLQMPFFRKAFLGRTGRTFC